MKDVVIVSVVVIVVLVAFAFWYGPRTKLNPREPVQHDYPIGNDLYRDIEWNKVDHGIDRWERYKHDKRTGEYVFVSRGAGSAPVNVGTHHNAGRSEPITKAEAKAKGLPWPQ